MSLRRTALTEIHRSAGARMADFGGWEMPIEYPTGVVAEHTAVRTAVGVFDVSHMGKLLLTGPGAVTSLNRLLANDLDRIGPGQAQYSMLCNDEGGVVDDLIVYRTSDDEVRIIPNAANAAAVRDTLRAGLPAAVDLVDRHESEGILAVQGPASRALLVGLELLPADADLGYMAFATGQFEGTSLVVCRTGYTGEHGYELVAPVEVLPALWAAITATAVPCGLGARDTLRTEMGYPLHGQDLSPSISPVEAGLSWAVGWDKAEFLGRDALVAQRAAGRPRALRGLLVEGRGIPRAHMAVTRPAGPDEADASVGQGAGETVVRAGGETTSGTFSPTLRAGIALALVDPTLAIGDEVAIDIRGRAVPARIMRLPFVDSSPK